MTTNPEEVKAEVIEPRSLPDLLKLESYETMTDTEVDMVIEWRVQQAVKSEELEARKAAIEVAGAAIVANAQQQREHAKSVLERLVENAPQFKEV